MQTLQNTPKRVRGLLASERGAAFLLQSYLFIFWFVVLTTALMTRSSVELQHAKLSAIHQQAFWKAEMALDETLDGLTYDPPTTLAVGQCTTPINRCQATVSCSETNWEYRYQVCRLEQGYQVYAAGRSTEPNVNAAVVVITAVAQDPSQNYQFQHQLLTKDETIVSQSTLGSINSSLNPAALLRLEDVRSLIESLEELPLGTDGGIATLAQDIGEGIVSGSRVYVTAEEASRVFGTIAVDESYGPNPGEAVLVTQSSTYRNPEGTNEVTYLTQDTSVLNPTVPRGAIALTRNHLIGEQTVELDQGKTYYTDKLYLQGNDRGAPTMRTSGVGSGVTKIYVTGPTDEDIEEAEVIKLQGGAKLYGANEMGQPIPGKLQLCVLTGKVRLTDYSLGSFVLVGPATFTMKDSALFGAVAGNTSDLEHSLALYDSTLFNQRFSINVSNPDVKDVEFYSLKEVPLAQVGASFQAGSFGWNPRGRATSGSDPDPGGDPPPSCFLAGTPILLPEGHVKPIEALQVGDLVLAYDEATRTLVPDRVKAVFRHEAQEYLIVNGHLKVTPNHPVYAGGRWVEIGTLAVGDALLNAKGAPEPITTLERVQAPVPVYNLEVNPYHTYIAGGVVVHNKIKWSGE